MTTTMEPALEGLLSGLVPADGPGIAIGVYQDGRLTSSTARGLACLEYGVPLTSRTRLDLASVSKQMTAACALLLHRDGVVHLDADLRRWLPELRLDGITMRGCLQHTTGLRDYEEVDHLRGGLYGEMSNLRQFLARLAEADDTNFPPGTDVSYSNTGYVAVAAALSRAAGRPFAELMRERVFAPLRMDDTLLHDMTGVVVPGMAFSYLPTDGTGWVRHEMPEELVGDGAVLSNLEDLASWHGFLLDGRGLGEDVRRQLVEPAALANGRRTRYGCGIAHSAVDGVSVLAHRGSMYAFRSYLVSVPDLGLGVTVLSNHGGTDPRPIAVEVLQRCLPALTAGRAGSWAAPGDLPEPRTWFCPVTGDSVDSGSLPDGTLTLTSGSSTAILSWDGTAWQAPDAGLRVEPGSGSELHVRDGLGRLRRYLPAGTSPAAQPEEAVGSYTAAELDGVRVERARDGLVVSVGRRRFAVQWVASYDGDDIYRASAGPLWLRRHHDDKSLGVSTGNTHFPRLRRVTGRPGQPRGLS